jgi:hypothetical protein
MAQWTARLESAADAPPLIGGDPEVQSGFNSPPVLRPADFRNPLTCGHPFVPEIPAMKETLRASW